MIGLPIYITGITLTLGYFLGLKTNPISGVTMWSIAICLFLIGHKKEGNLRTMTIIVFFKYLRSKISILSRVDNCTVSWAETLTIQDLLSSLPKMLSDHVIEFDNRNEN